MAVTAVHSGGKSGAAEIRAALRESRRLFASIALFSVFVNLLMLTGPLFMMQIYDRVLTSRSEATLVLIRRLPVRVIHRPPAAQRTDEDVTGRRQP